MRFGFFQQQYFHVPRQTFNYVFVVTTFSRPRFQLLIRSNFQHGARALSLLQKKLQKGEFMVFAFKLRYAIIEIVFEKPSVPVITKRDLVNSVIDAIHQMHGDVGYGVILPSLNVVFYDHDLKLAIIRFDSQYQDKFLSSIVFLKTIKDLHLRAFDVVAVCSTKRTLEKKVERIFKRNAKHDTLEQFKKQKFMLE